MKVSEELTLYLFCVIIGSSCDDQDDWWHSNTRLSIVLGIGNVEW